MARPEAPSGATDRIALAIAMGFGCGLAPVAPGTFGSLPALALAFACSRTGSPWSLAVALAIVSVLGTWAADRAAVLLGAKDPGRVVIDEVAGQTATLLFLPITVPVLAAGFLLFRVLDIWKPFPARRLESLPGGSGIMADDLMVGIYGNLLLQAAVAVFPRAMGAA